MSNPNHTLSNCKYDPTIVHMNGKGTIAVKNTTLTFGSRLTAHEHSTLSIEGGSHIGIDALTGFRDSTVFTKARDWYTPTGGVTHSEKPVRVEIEGNIHTYHAAIGEPTRNGHGDDVYDTSSVNLHVRGTWSMMNVHLWGNLGFDLETDKVEPVENMLNMPLATINHLKGNGVPDMVPQIILKRGHASYNLWYLMNQFTPRERNEVFTQTLGVARQVIQSGCTINQFCAFKDIHANPHCRCALYYPLLFERNLLALTYFLQAAEHTRQYVPESLSSIPNRMVEDSLDKTVLAHQGGGHNYHALEGSDMHPSDFVRKLSKPRFMAFLKSVGITDASVLWRAPEAG